MSFKPTHEFRGLELEYSHDYSNSTGFYRNSDGEHFHLPKHLVTKIRPRPRPGEVWKYLPGSTVRTVSLELVNSDGNFVDVDGIVTEPTSRSLQYFTKLLNADGTSA